MQDEVTMIDNITFERVEEFKHLRSTLTIKIIIRKKLREDPSQGMLATTRCRIVGLPFCYSKI
jgi:hypothetical protein